MFQKVLIANRGAIAVRIERTLKKMGIKSVALYTKADQDSLHVENADETIYLGDGPAKDTYLNTDKILTEAKRLGVEAVHPGYGFLSENTDFARACEANGIKFIGPTPEQIEIFGLKHSARELAERANVPLLPGTGLLSGLEEAITEAARIGYPVILKSTAGGGGIGMRVCYSKEELEQAYEAVCHLAQANFNNAGVFVEKYVVRSRHVEVQMFGNAYGEVVALGERDCSVQRRNQKVVEESPAPNLSDAVREKMYTAAKNLAKEASYRSAGTVEFLYDETSEEFYFLEVNTRLQVEHGITEEVHGVDLVESRVYGLTTNMQYLHALLNTEDYVDAKLFTGMLNDFLPEEHAIEVLEGGVQSTIQDYPGMIGYWFVGVPPCGPMDNYSFRIGNRILGNEEDAPGIEMTLRGGSYRFRTTVSFCLTGADMQATLDGEPISMYQVIHASPMQVLKLKDCKVGMRSYLLVAGGFDMPKIMGSSSTFVDGKFGGHNGRTLRTGDVLRLHDNCLVDSIASFPEKYRPQLTNTWTIGVLPGPQPTPEFLKEEYLTTLTESEYEVNFNSARTGVRLNGPIPQWVREDGGEAGLHPSNIHDNAYAIGTMDLTGDQSILLGPDGPSLGGFVCPVTTAKAELWKLGQLHPGDKVHFQLLTLEQAEALRKAQSANINLQYTPVELPEVVDLDYHYAILATDRVADTDIMVRLDGEENVLVEYGEMELSIDLRFRVHILMQKLQETDLPIINLTPGIRSIQVNFDVEKMDARTMTEQILKINREIPELENITVPSRIVTLPLSWDDPQTQLAAKRYMETVRENAPWCPSNPEFIRRINGLDTLDDVKRIVFDANYLVLGLGDVYLGAPVATPVDPRHRMVTTKYNPARPWTPENAVGIGGAYLCVYGMEGPGGYQFVGRTIQMWNPLKETKYFKAGKPWLLNFFDQIKFYPVSPEEILEDREKFLRGKFDIKIEETTFSFKEYKKFLADNADTIKQFKEHQEASFEAERQMWKEKGLDEFVSETEDASGIVDEVLPDGCEAARTNIPGSVWKVLVAEGDTVKAGDQLAVLESMKMEFPIESEYDGVVEKVYLKTGEVVNAGQLAVAIKTV